MSAIFAAMRLYETLVEILGSVAFFAVIVVILAAAVKVLRNGGNGPKSCPKCGAELRD